MRVADEWHSAFREFEAVANQVALVCRQELTGALMELGIFMQNMYDKTVGDPEEWVKALPEYVKRTKAINAMIRKELGIDVPG